MKNFPAFALLVAAGVARAEPSCLAYTPAGATLAGTVLSRTFAGPPEYVSIERGDGPERTFLLLLDEPVCVDDGTKSGRDGDTELGVVLVQVVPGRVVERLEGERVFVAGTLRHAVTGHDRTPVVLEAKDARRILGP